MVRVIQITDARALPEAELLARLENARLLPAEARARLCVQLRDPELGARELLALGERLRSLTEALGASFVVNDRLDLALLLRADGVHLGRTSVSVTDARRALGSSAWISVSCHGPDELRLVANSEVDAVLLSPVFSSPGKGPPLGLGAIAQARALLGSAGRPELVALGGVTAERVQACLDAGADGVAAIRADLLGTLGSRY